MQALLLFYPQGLESLDWEHATPLNLALRESHENTANHLIDKCPHALKLRNINGELPLDIAIRNSTSLRLFSKMVKAWPEGCRFTLSGVRKDEDVESWDWTKIELCLQAVSGFFEKKHTLSLDTREYLPLHSALELTFNVSLLNRILRTCPDLVSKKDAFGRLPLHIAAEFGKGALGPIIEQLLVVYPRAAYEIDSHGRLPIHIAIANKADLSTIKALLRANPKSAVQKCKINDPRLCGIPPLFLALEYGCSTDIIYTLARLYPNLCSCYKCVPKLCQSNS